MRFEQQHAIVIGGASGIGAATARRLADEGAVVTVADLHEGRAKEIADLVDGGAVAVDVTDTAAVRAAVVRAAAERGPIDVLVCCAGGDRPALFVDTTEADWEPVLALNLAGVLACTHAVLPEMQARRQGAIVHVASEAGRVGVVGGAVYTAAKAGVIGFTKAVAREVAPYGVRCNAVAPGPTDTPMLEELAAAGSSARSCAKA